MHGYAVKNDLVSISCKDGFHGDVHLSRTGVFSMSDGCKAYTGSSILQTTFELTSNYSYFIPAFDLFDCCNENKNKTNVPLGYLDLSLVPPVRANLDELGIASQKLEHIQRLSDNLMRETKNTQKMSIFEYVGYGLGGLFIVYFFVKIGLVRFFL